MADEKFDAIVVGAGPAGTSAALTMAKAGLNVVLLERGDYAGAKNVQGAVMYTKMLDDILPGFWKDPQAPVERSITEQKIWVLSKDSMFQVGFKSEKWLKDPPNCFTVIRANFDRWYAKKAEAAGVQLFTGVTVSEGLKKNGKVVGIKTSEGDEIFADVVIAADGVNSLLGQQLGLLDEWKADEVALGVKEVLALPREKIEDRFNLEQNEGTTIEIFGENTRGMLGYSFLYTNKESISFGVGAKLSHFQKTGIRPPDLLEYAKAHPMIRRLLKGAKPLEYSAHLIPEGGYNSMPKLFADGILIAGDAAQMVNASHREGSNLAMTAGRLAGETVIEAKKKGDFSAKTLSAYQTKLRDSFVIPDLFDHKDLETMVEKHMDIVAEGPELMAQSLYDYFQVDGRPKRDVQKAILQRLTRNPAVRAVIKSELTLKNEFSLVKMGLKLRLLLWKLTHGGSL
ncbi:MAG TPA: FAD-dependent monooxygenase [Elusimicrobiota bacterium]|nr:FAD-dependent monooxygenase [Elusimicrobiota bacterium]